MTAMKTCYSRSVGHAGLIPEEFLEKLASQRTDYYFAELTQHTARMAGLFKACFANAANADFHRMDMSKVQSPPSALLEPLRAAGS